MMGMITPPNSQHAAPHRGAMILVLGILSLVVCQLLGPFAWVMGRSDLKRINAGQMNPEGRGLTTAGMVLGIVSTALLVLSVCGSLLWILFMVILFGAAVASA